MNLYGRSVSAADIYAHFAPWDVSGRLYDARRRSEIMAEWSVYFLGDPDLAEDSHYHIRGDVKEFTEESWRELVPPFHVSIYEDLCSDYPRYFISAPSEFGKTTTATLVYPLYMIYYFAEPYVVLSSRVRDTSIERLDELKTEIDDNRKLIDVYGELRGGRSYAWSDYYIELTNGSKVRAVPVGGNVRGRKRGGMRITLFILDDPEEIADCRSEAVIKEHTDWLHRSAVPRLDKEYGKARVVGTMISLNSTLAQLAKDPRWIGRVYKALVDDPLKPAADASLPIEKRRSIWEARWTTAYLQKEREGYRDAGKIEDWYFERMNEPLSTLSKSLSGYHFHNARFERRGDANLLWLEGHLDPVPVYTYIAIDPAFSKARSADERALVSFAMGMLPTESGLKTCIWVLEYDFNHMDPDMIIDRALDLHKMYFYRELIVETVGGQKIYEYITTKRIHKDPFLIRYPLATQFINYQASSKEDRIYNYFRIITRLGQLYIRPGMSELRAELDEFLECRHLHILDALEMGCRNAVPCREERPHIRPARPPRERPKPERSWLLW